MQETKSGGKKVRAIILNSVRTLLLLTFFMALVKNRDLITLISAIAFTATFLPEITKKIFKIDIPASFEVIMIFFVYGLLFFGKIKGYYDDFRLLSLLLNFSGAIALGLVGLAVLYALKKEERIDASPAIIAIFSFSFAVAVGLLWEIFVFSLSYFFGFNLQKSANEPLLNLTANVAGAFLVSAFGYSFIKKGKITLISTTISNFVSKNPKLFGKPEHSHEKIKNLIKKGESHDLEFKSTLRTNLFTSQPDKKIEQASLKTLVAYLNSKGGTLLVGVSDKGEISGIEKDSFQSHDHMNRHVTNLIREHIGNEFLPFIKHEIIEIEEGKKVLKIECSKSSKPAFLKLDKNEEFYVRSGSSSTPISGSSLIDYVKNNF